MLQSFVYGDSLRSSVVAVVVPDPDHLLPWAAERRLPADLAQLCGNPRVVEAVHKAMRVEGRASGPKGFAPVRGGGGVDQPGVDPGPPWNGMGPRPPLERHGTPAPPGTALPDGAAGASW